MQLSLRTLVSRAFDAADWVIIRTLSGVQVASKKFWVSDNSEDGIMRACLETQKLEQLEARMDEIAERVARERTGDCNQQPRIGRIPLALIAVSHVAAVPSALSLSHLATQAFTLRKPSARQDAWHFDWQSESHPLAWPFAWPLT